MPTRKTKGLPAPRTRRSEWNALLIVMFALLAVAPSSLLAAAPLSKTAVAQPQQVWQWLQSPEGAPTRAYLAQALDCENFAQSLAETFPHLPPDDLAAVMAALKRGPQMVPTTQLAWATRTKSSSFASFRYAVADSLPVLPVAIGALPRLAFSSHACWQRTLSPHEAAFRSGIRTNRRLI